MTTNDVVKKGKGKANGIHAVEEEHDEDESDEDVDMDAPDFNPTGNAKTALEVPPQQPLVSIAAVRQKLQARIKSLKNERNGLDDDDDDRASTKDELLEEQRAKRAALRENRRKKTKERIAHEREGEKGKDVRKDKGGESSRPYKVRLQWPCSISHFSHWFVLQ